MFEDGRFLTCQPFVDAVREALERAGVDQTKYCGHSFRIGAATTAAARGVEDAMIKTLGRWESVTYLRYIKISRQQLAGYSAYYRRLNETFFFCSLSPITVIVSWHESFFVGVAVVGSTVSHGLAGWGHPCEEVASLGRVKVILH